MESLYLLIPITSVICLAAAGVYLWAAHSGQFDNLELEASRILFESDEPPSAPKET